MSTRNAAVLLILAFVCISLVALSAAGCTQKTTPVAVAAPAPEVQVAAPVISELTATTQVPALGKTQIVCEASGGESENLTYGWTSTGGTLVGSGSTVSWTAPEKPGDYMVTMTVSGSAGGTKTRDIVITVPQKPNNPPVITAITFTRPSYPPITVKPHMTDEGNRKLPELVIRTFESVFSNIEGV